MNYFVYFLDLGSSLKGIMFSIWIVWFNSVFKFFKYIIQKTKKQITVNIMYK